MDGGGGGGAAWPDATCPSKGIAVTARHRRGHRTRFSSPLSGPGQSLWKRPLQNNGTHEEERVK